ncbi:MAG: hypothetical protein PWP03_519 [Candidatus Woesearchaeota archaeon]|nr:hypothetical protein [Candidatus Woesearchaeota archaeon]MDN5327881.1 hypothetical protein [Candidatus Woesearchaeota archaeon]
MKKMFRNSSLDNKVDKEYSFFKKAVKKAADIGKKTIIGIAAFALSSCVSPTGAIPPGSNNNGGNGGNNNSQNIQIYNVQFYQETEGLNVGDVGLSFNLDAFDATQVIFGIYGSDGFKHEEIFNAPPGESEVHMFHQSTIDTRIQDLNLVPYELTIIATNVYNPLQTTSFSTTLESPTPHIAKKAPDVVNTLESLLQNYYLLTSEYSYIVTIRDNEDPTLKYYFIVRGVEYSYNEVEFSISDYQGGWIRFSAPTTGDSTVVEYSLQEEYPFDSYSSTATVEDILNSARIEYETVDASTIRAPLPREIFKQALALARTDDSVKPLYDQKTFISGHDNTTFVDSKRYYNQNIMSDDVVEEIKYFYNRNQETNLVDAIAYSTETGNILLIGGDISNYYPLEGKVVINSPFIFVGDVPAVYFGVGVSTWQDNIKVDNGAATYYSLYDLPQEYKDYAENKLDELEAFILGLQ